MGDTNRSFYPTPPNANQPFDLSLEDFLSPGEIREQKAKSKPALDTETETALVEMAMRDH